MRLLPTVEEAYVVQGSLQLCWLRLFTSRDLLPVMSVDVRRLRKSALARAEPCHTPFCFGTDSRASKPSEPSNHRKTMPRWLSQRLRRPRHAGVEALHANGIIHTDLKLENAMINCQGSNNCPPESWEFGSAASRESFWIKALRDAGAVLKLRSLTTPPCEQGASLNLGLSMFQKLLLAGCESKVNAQHSET